MEHQVFIWESEVQLYRCYISEKWHNVLYDTNHKLWTI